MPGGWVARVARHLELPAEAFGVTRLVVGRDRIDVENHRGRVAFSPQEVVFRMDAGTAAVAGEALRLRTYRRIAALTSTAERDELQRELEDRFGPLPRPVENLLDYAVLKAVAERLAVAAVERRGDRIAVRFHQQTPVEPQRIVELVRRGNGMRLDPAGVLWLVAERDGRNLARQVTNLLLQLQPER